MASGLPGWTGGTFDGGEAAEPDIMVEAAGAGIEAPGDDSGEYGAVGPRDVEGGITGNCVRGWPTAGAEPGVICGGRAWDCRSAGVTGALGAGRFCSSRRMRLVY